MWDEALQSATTGSSTPAQSKPKSKGKKTGNTGTVWDAGRNWTTVVIEIVPPLLPAEDAEDAEEEGAEKVTELDRLVQVPVSVHVEYETDLEREDGLGGREQKEKREHTYWSVLGLGRIGKLSGDVMGASGPAAGMSAGRPSSYSVSKVGSGQAAASAAIGAGKGNRHSVK